MKKTILAFLTLLGTLLPAAAQETVTGKVVDKKGNPIPGVWIEIPNSPDHTISDLDGTFTITHSNPYRKKLEASFAGMGNKKVKIKDGMIIKMKETPNWKQAPQDWNWFIQAIVASPTSLDGMVYSTDHRNPNKLAYGLMVGRVKKWGYYVKGVTNFLSSKDCNGYYDSSDGFIEKQTYEYWSATAGGMLRLGCPLYLYLGAGYAKYQYKVKTLDGDWYESESGYQNKNDLVMDLGFLLRIKRVTISLGTTAAPWSQNHGGDFVAAANLGIGYSF